MLEGADDDGVGVDRDVSSEPIGGGPIAGGKFGFFAPGRSTADKNAGGRRSIRCDHCRVTIDGDGDPERVAAQPVAGGKLGLLGPDSGVSRVDIRRADAGAPWGGVGSNDRCFSADCNRESEFVVGLPVASDELRLLRLGRRRTRRSDRDEQYKDNKCR
jgi:hypothetical protein